jgi:hypothetical protein
MNQNNQPVLARHAPRPLVLVVDCSTWWWISTTCECTTSPQNSSLQGNPNRFRMAMLARALRFTWDKNT